MRSLLDNEGASEKWIHLGRYFDRGEVYHFVLCDFFLLGKYFLVDRKALFSFLTSS